MTADAKVGLLLGLVFIVIIAFIVNGLPDFFKQSEPDFISHDVEVPRPDVIIDLPPEDYAPRLKPKVKPRQVPIPTGTDVVNTEVTTVAVETSVKPKKVAVAKHSPKVKMHRVQEGDTLGAILESAYGSGGKKQSTIDLVMKANHLDSPDVILLGQVLKLPALSGGGSRIAKGPSLIARIIEPFTNLRKKKTEAKKSEVKKPVKMERRRYKVKAGECLSQIASKQCGTIKHVDAIMKLNDLQDADNIVEGMVLKLPPVQLGK